jgi:DNA-binding transcriptional regulator YdaS (Cro superfamily)
MSKLDEQRSAVIKDLFRYLEASHPANRRRRRFSGARLIADEIGVTPQAVYQWRRIPSDHVKTLVRMTAGAYPRERLRPDLYA